MHHARTVKALPFALLATSILFGVAGQLLLKWAALVSASQAGAASAASAIALAVGVYSLGVLSWMGALRHLPLSVAYPITSVSYIGILWGSYHFFGEHVAPMRALGVCAVFFGVMLVVLGARRSARAGKPV